MKSLLIASFLLVAIHPVFAQTPPPSVTEGVRPTCKVPDDDADVAPDTVSQSVSQPVSDTTVFTFVEEPPVFPGGDSAWRAFVNNSIRYPQMAKEQGIQGNVYVRFVVEKDGSISNVEVLKHPNSKDLANEARRIVMSSPRWTPGKQSGKIVRTSVVQPIRFTLH